MQPRLRPPNTEAPRELSEWERVGLAGGIDSGDNPDMPSRSPRKRPATPKPPDPAHILVIDVGGSHIKFRVGPRGRINKFVSGPEMTAGDMAREVRKRTRGLSFEAVSIGYPGLVLRGRIAAEPFNLGPGWVGYDFEKALGCPVRVINDATMQALGSYEGGRMLFLGLGTGLGATLILDGTVEPMEIGHMPYKHGRTFEDYVGERGRERLGNKKWRKAVADVVARLKEVLEADYVVLGGGNASRLKELPEGARLGNNLNAFKGGLHLWRGDDPLATGTARRQRAVPPPEPSR
jgi:predicted NBD/HSP70 family sugar kinase